MLIVSRIKSYMALVTPLFMIEAEPRELVNYPVNLDHVTWIESDATIAGVDGKRHPAITFHLICSTPITWAGYADENQREHAIQGIKRRMQVAEIGFS